MAELLHELFCIEVDFTPHYETQAEGLRLLLASKRAEIFVAEINGEVVGMCTMQIMISTAKGREVCQVEDVVVDVEHRGKGIGSSLLRRVEEWAFTHGLGRIQLNADRDNHPALGFYRRQGWRQTNLINWMKHL